MFLRAAVSIVHLLVTTSGTAKEVMKLTQRIIPWCSLTMNHWLHETWGRILFIRWDHETSKNRHSNILIWHQCTWHLPILTTYFQELVTIYLFVSPDLLINIWTYQYSSLLQVLEDAGCFFQERHGWERPGWFNVADPPKVRNNYIAVIRVPFGVWLISYRPFRNQNN